MVDVEFDSVFQDKIKKIRDNALLIRIKKQIAKIVGAPEMGKPMRHERKGTREVYVSPFRLSYAYLHSKNLIIFLNIYHKDKQ